MRLALGLLLIVTASIQAAPPAVTGLVPAGGQHGTTVEVTAIGSFDTWPVQFWTSSPLISITCGKEKGKLIIKLNEGLVPGVYWLRCYSAEGASGLRPFIVGTLPEVMEAEPNDTLAKAQPVALPAVVNGKLNKNGDLDGYSVSLQKGQTLVASVESHHTLRSAADMVMQLADSSGTVITQNHDYHGLDPQITFTAPRDGKYLVRVFAFPANPDSSIRYSGGDLYFYRLTLTTGPFLDHVLPLARGDDSTLLRLQGWNLNSQTQVGRVQLGSEFTHVYHPAASGMAAIQQEHWTVFDDSVDDRTSRVLSVPSSVTAPLTTKRPVYRTQVSLQKGKKVYLEALSQTLGLETDPVLTLHDAAGKEVHRAEAAALHADVKTSFTPPADGIYTLAVRDLHGRSGWRQVVLLRVFPAEPRFTLTVDADRFSLTAGKPLDIPVKVTAIDGYAETPVLQVEGLPGGVKWKVHSTTGKDAVKTVTLRLESTVASNGPFRIVAKGPKAIVASASLGDFGITTSDLWLTVSVPVKAAKK
ncbi:MAG: PPC domain-containing protein [Gemmatales bacterium]